MKRNSGVTTNELFGLIIILFLSQVFLINFIMSEGLVRTTGLTAGYGITTLIVKNDPPVSTMIPDQTWLADHSIMIDLNAYFSDPEGIELSFWNDNVTDMSITITDGVVMITPSPGFVGVRQVVFYASDGSNTVPSNNVTLNVVGEGETGRGSHGCYYRWECQPWSECLPEGYQERGCINLGTCSNAINPPAINRLCDYEVNEGEGAKEPELEIPASENATITLVEERGSGFGDKVSAETMCYEDEYGLYRALMDIPKMILLLILLAVILGIFVYATGIWYYFLFGAAGGRKVFIAYDGQKARSARELGRIIRKMTRTTFKRHVHIYTNDFADWVYHGLGDKRLAGRLKDTKQNRESYSALLLGRKNVLKRNSGR